MKKLGSHDALIGTLANFNTVYSKNVIGGIRMKVTKIMEIEAFQNPHSVEAKRLYNLNGTEVIHMSLKPGQSLKKHITPVNVIFYIIEGKGRVEIGDEMQEVEKDMLIDSPKNIPHLLSNTGESIFRFLVIKLPC